MAQITASIVLAIAVGVAPLAGQLSVLDGWDAAQAHLAKAEDRARDINDDIQGADIKRFRAMMLLDRKEAGDAEAADRLLRAAAAAYAALEVAPAPDA